MSFYHSPVIHTSSLLLLLLTPTPPPPCHVHLSSLWSPVLPTLPPSPVLLCSFSSSLVSSNVATAVSLPFQWPNVWFILNPTRTVPLNLNGWTVLIHLNYALHILPSSLSLSLLSLPPCHVYSYLMCTLISRSFSSHCSCPLCFLYPPPLLHNS